MKELIDKSTCEDALEAVQAATKQSSAPAELSSSRTALASSLKDFTQSSSRVIKQLYAGPKRERGLYEDSDDDTPVDATTPELGEMADGPNETVFLIYL